MKTLNTATITWIKHFNFGTFLQAYALQQYLLSMGHGNKILDDSFIKDPYQKFIPQLKLNIKAFITSIWNSRLRDFQSARRQSHRKYNKFLQENMNIEYQSSDFKKVSEEYDVFICGSDQIWNPISIQHKDAGFYYANFTSKKRISYAPSLGRNHYPSSLLPKLKQMLKGFTYLSVREDSGKKLLEEVLEREVQQVVDPTLLLSKTEWKKLIPSVPKKEKYVLAYFLTPNDWYLKYVKAYAKKRNLRLKMFLIYPEYLEIADETIVAGPIEFIQEIENAEIFFTDSFHGSVFASIYETEFITFKRFNDTAANQNTRIESLFRMMAISDRYIGEKDCDRIETLSPLDFNALHENIAPYINESKYYLTKSLE